MKTKMWNFDVIIAVKIAEKKAFKENSLIT
jgi:hypothetical protein